MTLKTKLRLMVAVPLVGLVTATTVFFVRTQSSARALELARTESSVFADLARSLQLNVVQVQQYLSDISATRGQDGLDDGFAKAAEQRAAFLTGVHKFAEMYRRENATAQLAATEKVEQAFASYYETGMAMAQAYVKDGPAAGNKLMGGFDAAATKLTETLEPFVQDQVGEFQTSLEQLARAGQRTARLALAGGLGLTLLVCGYAWRAIRSISEPIAQAITELTAGAEHVAAAAQEVSGASQALAEGASEQAASLEETSASLEEITSMTKRSAVNAEHSATLSRQTRESAAAGLTRIAELERTLAAIKAAVTEMQVAVGAMQSSSGEISKIIKTIDEIAFQTNLLALNAAVEAARAGEAGAGFAVVADEVRSLAQRSARAVQDTTTKISAAVARSESGGVASSKVVASLGEVEATVRGLESVFTGIVTQINSLDGVIAEIAAASREQNQGVSEVNMAVSQMDKVTQGNAASAEENAGAAEELKSQVQASRAIIQHLQSVIAGRQPALASTAPGLDHGPTSVAFGAAVAPKIAANRIAQNLPGRTASPRPVASDFRNF